jgi:ATP-dependent DNA helicase RecG
VQQFREGLFKHDIPTFDEDSVREAILNAVSHRDYRNAGSIWVRQYPRLLEIESPGGFPEGITADNVRDRQNPRTRRIAEALARCSLVGPPPYQWRANCSSIWPARNVASNVTGLT